MRFKFYGAQSLLRNVIFLQERTDRVKRPRTRSSALKLPCPAPGDCHQLIRHSGGRERTAQTPVEFEMGSASS
jgi:hypothetical protein